MRRRLAKKKIPRRLGRSAVVSVGIASNLLLTSCGPDFHLAQKVTPEVDRQPSKNTSNEQEPASVSNPSRAAWEKLQVEGLVNGGSFDKVPILSLKKTSKELVIRLPMTRNPYLGESDLRVMIPELPQASLGLDPLDSAHSALVLRMPLQYLVDGVANLPLSGLPNQEPIPTIAAGALPSIAIPLSVSGQVQAHLYLLPGVVGIYVNTPHNPFIRLTLPVRSPTQTRTLGSFATIPANLKYDGGYLVLVRLPDDMMETIANNI